MAHISKHNSKEKWECYNAKNGRVRFQISRDTVSINNLLIDSCKFVSLHVSWSRYIMIIVGSYTHRS